jgi:hypothetical protein
LGLFSEIDVVREDPFNDAVTVAVSSCRMLPAVTVNVAVDDPDATTADEGALRAMLPVEIATVPPLLRDNVTVHVALPPLSRL